MMLSEENHKARVIGRKQLSKNVRESGQANRVREGVYRALSLRGVPLANSGAMWHAGTRRRSRTSW